MIELDAISYVLKAHRDLPDAEQPRWTLSMLRADASEAVASLAPARDATEAEKSLAWSRQGVAQVGHSLRRVNASLTSDGQAVPPVPAELPERIEWVRRWLPTRWVAELAVAAGKLDDLDPEAE